MLVDGKPTHLFDCFALVNFLPCSAVPSESARNEATPLRGRPGRSTPTMQRNCTRHFIPPIEVLDPTVIVVQGRGVLTWMKSAFNTLSDETVQAVWMNGRECHVLAFTHPSAKGSSNWGINDRTPYLLGVVVPSVQKIIRQLEL